MVEDIKKISQSERILDAAYECISLKGYANVSLREIANEAGVALSQLHYYFGSKKDLFKAITKKMVEKYLSEIENHLKKGKTAIEKTSSLIAFFSEMLEHNSGLFRLLYDFTSLALWSDCFRESLSSLFKELSGMIEEFILESGSLKEDLKGFNPKALSRMILGSMFGIAIQAVLDPDNEEIIDGLYAIQLVLE